MWRHTDVHSKTCTSGFIDRDVLERRASKIDSDATGVSSTIVSRGQFLVMPGWNFSCSGTITSLVVGVEVRDLNGNVARIDLWRPRYNSLRVINSYEWVPDAQTYLNFRPGDFTPDGVYEFHIAGSGIQYRSGDIFGVYQSSTLDSPVRIFYTNQLAAPLTFGVDTPYGDTNSIQPSGYDLFTTGTVLVRPISGMYITVKCMMFVTGQWFWFCELLYSSSFFIMKIDDFEFIQRMKIVCMDFQVRVKSDSRYYK